MELRGYLYKKLKPKHQKNIDDFLRNLRLLEVQENNKIAMKVHKSRPKKTQHRKIRSAQKLSKERMQKKEHTPQEIEEMKRLKEQQDLENFEIQLIGKKRVSPFHIKDLYFDCFAKKYGLGDEDELNKFRNIIGKRKIDSENFESEINEHYEKEQKRKGLEKFTDSGGNEKWGTKIQIRNWKEIELGLGDNFQSTNSQDFEELMGKLLGKMGFREVEVTRATKDYGIDIIAKRGNQKIAFQCKKWQGGVVSNKDVRDAMAGALSYNATKLIFITTSRFTKEAENQVDMTMERMKIELWGKDKLKSLVREYLIE